MRQVPNVQHALQHNVGLGGAVVITLYQRADRKKASQAPQRGADGRNWAGYNPAIEARWLNDGEINRVRSVNNRSEYMLKGRKRASEARL